VLSKAAHAEEGAPVAGSRLMLRNTSTYLEQRRQSSAVFVFAQTTHETTGFTVHCKHTAVRSTEIYSTSSISRYSIHTSTGETAAIYTSSTRLSVV